MQHKKYWVTAAALAMVGVSGPAVAADLHNGEGQSCGNAVGTWHFVNNQTGAGAAAGTLTAEFTSGTVTVSASKVNLRTQHFDVEASGTLLSATTDLDGMLVLSDHECGPYEPPTS